MAWACSRSVAAAASHHYGIGCFGIMSTLCPMPAQVLAANIFDWGAKATVQLYHNGTILEIYR
jgi:hypothetical protein